MNIVEGQKYEVQIAKSTLPKSWHRKYIATDVWYPATKVRASNNPNHGCFFGFGRDYFVLKNCPHLDGGNWKIRKVKEKKENV